MSFVTSSGREGTAAFAKGAEGLLVTPDALHGFCEAIGEENVWQKTQRSLETGVKSLIWAEGFHQL